MHLERTPEQQEMAEACRDLLAKAWPRGEVEHRLAVDPLGADVWSAAVEMGWFHVLTPVSAGGLGLSAVEASAVAEEAGAGLFPGPLIDAMLAGLVPGVDPAVTTIAPLALAGLHLAGRRCNGLALLVPYADSMETMVCFVTDGAGDDVVVAVDLRSPGVAVEVQPSADVVSRPCSVRLERAGVELLATDDQALVIASVVTDMARCLTASMLLGIATAALDLAVNHAKTREQFGRPIGSFQAVQQLLADLAKSVVAARSVCHASQAAVAGGLDDAPVWARVAKAYASRATRRVVEQALQVHGGIGFTTEVPLHLYIKRALTLRAAWGDEREHEMALGRAALQAKGCIPS